MRVAVLIAAFFGILTISVFAQSGPPALCNPCLFYGGDESPTDPDSTIFYNENTPAFPNTSTYGAVTIPRNRSVLIEGILFQVMEVTPPSPKGATWDIRTGVGTGGGGTSIASGQGPVVMQPTGRFFNQYLEYTTVIKVSPAVQLDGGSGPHGTTYWFNLTPVCERGHNCGQNQWFVSNTPELVNNFRGSAQPGAQVFIFSEAYGYNWVDWCSLGLNGQQCSFLSFGLTGKVLQ
jgi:hypothetical protein